MDASYQGVFQVRLTPLKVKIAVDEQYFYAIGGQRKGPISFTPMHELVAKGELKRTGNAWRRGIEDRQAAKCSGRRSCRPVCLLVFLLLIVASVIGRADDLIQAVRRSDIPAIKRVIEQGADVNATSGPAGGTALFFAVGKTNTEITRLLLANKADPNSEDKEGRSPLMFAAMNGQSQLCNLLLEAGASVEGHARNGWTPLMVASIEGHQQIVELLLSHGADVKRRGANGETALFCAADAGHVQVCSTLLSAGADVNGLVLDGITPLIAASRKGHLGVIEFLLRHGAGINARSNQGATALLWAVGREQKEAAEFLLSHGADPNITTPPDGEIPLLAAMRSNRLDIAKLLLKHGANANATNSHSFSPLFFAKGTNMVLALIAGGADVNLRGGRQFTPLHMLAATETADVVAVLVEHGADVNAKNDDGFTPLFLANGTNTMMALIAGGANVNERDPSGSTPLHYFSYGGKAAQVAFLLKMGADPKLQNEHGSTPADAAEAGKHHELATLLRNAVERKTAEASTSKAVDENSNLIPALSSTKMKGAENPNSERPPVNAERVVGLADGFISKTLSLPGQRVANMGIIERDWRARNEARLTNMVWFAPFRTAVLTWDNDTGAITTILLQMSVTNRPVREEDPYYVAEDLLTKAYGPSDIIDLSVSLVSKHESEWHLGRKSVFLRRIPHEDDGHETIDYLFSVVGKEPDIPLMTIDSAFGYALGATMPQDLVRAGQPQKAGGVIVGVMGLRPHPALNTYALVLTPRSGKICSIYGMFSGDGVQAAGIFAKALREARANYDYDSCEFEKSYSVKSVRLEKGDRSIVVDFRVEGVAGPATVSVRFVDGQVSDQAVLEAKGF